MKSFLNTIVVLAIAFSSILAQNNCTPLLEKGIFTAYPSSNSYYLKQNIYEFLSFSDDQKKSFEDRNQRSFFREGNWIGQRGILDALLKWSKPTSSSRAIYQKIEEEFRKNGDLSSASYNYVLTKIADQATIDSWQECMADELGTLRLETTGPTDVAFLLKIVYPIVAAATMENVLEITSINFTNLEPEDQNSLVQGAKIYPVIGANQRFIRLDKLSASSLVLNLSNGATLNLSLPAIPDISKLQTNIQINMPVGTIIASVVPFDKFREIMGDTGPWSARSKWAPCDNREIFNSDLHRLSGNTIVTVPDLRGQFLRGLNKFSNDEVEPVLLDRKDPDGDNRIAGNPQSDAIREHVHGVSNFIQPGGAGGTTSATNKYKVLIHRGKDSVEVTDPHKGHKEETRPKNVAVYYYIKINN